MNDARSSFGCVISPHLNEIYVVGGYCNGEMTRKCERYNITENTWTQMPEISEAKVSTSLCVLGGKTLYCFGGLVRN